MVQWRRRPIASISDITRLLYRISCSMLAEEAGGDRYRWCMMLDRRRAMALPAAMIAAGPGRSSSLAATTDMIDDLSQPPPRASNGASWELIADRVMGGVSNGNMRREVVQGRCSLMDV